MYGEMVIVFIFIGLALFIVWLMAIYLLVEAAKEKGFHRDGAGMLWLVGIFASPIVLGLYTASLPDRGQTQAPVIEPDRQIRDEMPRI